MRLIGFLACTVLLLSFLSTLLMPVFGKEGDSVRGMYDVPRDSISVTCLGASSLVCAFSPDRLYEEYGIASYNNCSSNQPTLSSYYLLRECKRLHPNSLSLVVLDAMPLVKNTDLFDSYVWTERVAMNMRPSLNKYRMIYALSQEYQDYGFTEHLIPLLSYHDRWAELETDDYDKVFDSSVDGSAHGQLIDYRSYTSNVSKGDAGKYVSDNVSGITAGMDSSREDLEGRWNESSKAYMDKIVEFCRESDMELLLLKTPMSTWTDEDHDSVQLYADEMGAAFLDMNTPDAWSKSGLSYDTDYRDGKHVNLLGSLKTTDLLGNYIASHYDLGDKAGKGTGFSEEDLESYGRAVKSAELLCCENLDEYLEALDQDRYTVFVTTRGGSYGGLDESTREALAKLGLEGLADISDGASYAGILHGGERIKQKVAKNNKEATITCSYDRGEVNAKKTNVQPGAIIENLVTLTASPKKSSVLVEEEEQSENLDGINFVVYDDELDLQIDTSSFATDGEFAGKRISDLPIYN